MAKEEAEQEIRELSIIAEKLKSLQDQLNTVTDSIAEQEARSLLNKIKKAKAEAKKELKDFEELTNNLQVARNKIEIISDESNAAFESAENKRQKQRRKNLEDLIGNLKEQKKQIEKYNRAFENNENEKIKILQRQEKKLAEEELKASNERKKRLKKQNDELIRLVKTGAQAGKDLVTDFTETVGAPLATLAFLRPDLGAMQVLKSLKKEFIGFDDTFRGVIKQTGLFNNNFRKVFIDSIGTSNRFNNALQDIGATSKDAAEAAKALFPVSEVFRRLSMRGDNAAKSVLGQAVAFKKLNIPAAQTAKSFDTFTKALGLNAKQSVNTNKQILGVAKSLNIGLGKAFKDFTDILPDIVMFGDDTVEVFGKLEAQANATGLAVNQLSKFAQKMDTFKGASEVAARFNAQLGGMFVSGIDLAQADFPEKIGMIQKAFQNAGKTFDDLGRRDKQALAASLGLGVEETARLLSNAEDVEASLKKVDTAAMTDRQQRKAIQDTMSQQELLLKSNARFMRGIGKFTQKTRQIATQAGGAITKSFARANSRIRKSKDEIASVAGVLAALTAVTTVGGAIPKQFRRLFGGRFMTASMAALGGAAFAGAVTHADLQKLNIDNEADKKIFEKIRKQKAILEDDDASKAKKLAAEKALKKIHRQLKRRKGAPTTSVRTAPTETVAQTDADTDNKRIRALQKLGGADISEDIRAMLPSGSGAIDLGGAGMDTAFERDILKRLVENIETKFQQGDEQILNIILNVDGEPIAKTEGIKNALRDVINQELRIEN